MNVISSKPNVSLDTDANNNTKLKRVTSENGMSAAAVAVVKENDLNNNNGHQYSLNHLIDEELLTTTNNNTPWNVSSSELAKSTRNPVRRLIEQMKIEPNPSLPMIALSIGDPTIMSDLGKPDSVAQAILKCIVDKKNDGYTHSCGSETARQAIAKFYSRADSNLVYRSQDIYLTSGCSHALDLCIMALAGRGKNILIPKPGFSIYKTLAGTLDIDTRHYQLMDDKGWEADLTHMESLIDSNTVAILVNNPSNPCGSVYSKRHLLEIISLAERHRLPIIADEVYGEMVFPGQEFYYMAELSDSVPILSCNALSKRFILPGWRFGWIAIHDPKDHLKSVRAGFNDLTTRLLAPSSLVQAALPDILENTPQSYFDNVMQILSENAGIVYNRLSQLPGLTARKPSGAMYLMVGIDLRSFPDFKSDLEFVQALIREQSVFCLPAEIFECPNYIRIVITMKKEKIMEACDRIEQFVLSHYRK